jgi:hypothetical protein
VKSYLGLGCENKEKKMKTEEIFDRLQDRNRHILGFVSNELSMDVPTTICLYARRRNQTHENLGGV